MSKDLPIMTPKRNAQQASPMYNCGDDEDEDHDEGSGNKTDLFADKQRKHAKLGRRHSFRMK